MHELGVTFHIMDQLEKVAQENDVERVRKVVLELGEVSTVIESYLQSCWTWAASWREARRPLWTSSSSLWPMQRFSTECLGPPHTVW